jgi:hypothetical protein
MLAINLVAMFADHFKPRTVGQLNGHDLMVVKVKGPFTWHDTRTPMTFFSS